jgi:pimeloyl-ACP methyl ester carboxylesterase
MSPAPLPHRRDVVVDGATLRVLRAGSGPALLYLHGVGDLGAGDAWMPVLGELAGAYDVVRPDHPGFNASDDLPTATPGDVAAVHLRLLDALGLDEVTLVGGSFGGWVATELALQAPERVRRLVLVDPAGMPGAEPLAPVLELEPAESAALTFGDPAMAASARERGAALAETDPVAAAYERRNRATARRLAGTPPMLDPTLPARAGALAPPLTVLWGELDRITPVSHAQEWVAAVPGARLVVVPGAGHLPQVEQPAAFLAASGLLG